MKQGYNAAFIYTSDFVGVNLGSDYTSEHEWGISDIKISLSINEKAGNSLACRKVNKVHNLHWYERTDFIGFVCYHFYADEFGSWKPRNTFTESDKDKSFYSGWSRNGFYLVTKNTSSNQKVIERIKKIYEALNNKNACVWLGGGHVFQNAGLCIGIVDKMPKEIFQQWADNDKLILDTKKAFEKTGIEKILNDAGKKWFALSPKIVNGKLTIWLNPYNQNKYEAGWFTVDELKLWAEDKGPIMKVHTKNKR